MLVPLLFCAPWLVAVAWIVHRHGRGILFPRDDVPVSFGELARRRTVGS
jgi:hypothetical protein